MKAAASMIGLFAIAIAILATPLFTRQIAPEIYFDQESQVDIRRGSVRLVGTISTPAATKIIELLRDHNTLEVFSTKGETDAALAIGLRLRANQKAVRLNGTCAGVCANLIYPASVKKESMLGSVLMFRSSRLEWHSPDGINNPSKSGNNRLNAVRELYSEAGVSMNLLSCIDQHLAIDVMSSKYKEKKLHFSEKNFYQTYTVALPSR